MNVIITVRDGVAYVTQKPKGVSLEILDFDNYGCEAEIVQGYGDACAHREDHSHELYPDDEEVTT